jgi:membrane fusion protein, copper/silver efflux system
VAKGDWGGIIVMKKIMNIPIWSLILIVLLGTMLIRPSPAPPEDAHDGHTMDIPSSPAIEYWTCGMHPSVKISVEQYDKGSNQCPICSMDLVPVRGHSQGEGSEAGEENLPRLTLSKRSRRLAGIETTEVERIPLFKEIYTVGTVTYDEGKIALVSAWFAGRIDRLFVDFTCVPVKKGEHLVWIFSPQLITAQEEYLLSLKAASRAEGSYEGADDLLKASRRKLLRLGLTEEQLEKLEKEKEVQDHITVYSPIGGTVIHKNAVEGMYVKEGDPIYKVADLTSLWVTIDIYEYELGWVRLYQEVEITMPAFPGEVFRGKIAFIDPFLNPKTRTAKVRINLPNPELRFKPEMYVNARIRIPLGEFGMLLSPGMIGKYICPMHPEVVLDQAESCPRCGMDLIKVEGEMIESPRYICPMGCIDPRDNPGRCPECGMALVKDITEPDEEATSLAIPKSAVLETGRRQIVWVDKGEGKYEARTVTLGPPATAEINGADEPYFPVISGLREGEKVVTRGNFLIDSQSQLSGFASAEYGGALGDGETPVMSSGHQH